MKTFRLSALAMSFAAICVAPSSAQEPQTALPAAAAAAAAAPQTPAPVAPAAKPAKVKAKTDAAKAGPEQLPWAAKSEPAAGGKTAADKPLKDRPQIGNPKPDAPLKMACAGLYEAACREVPACTWIADVKLGTGADVKAHCVDLKPAASKTTTAKKASDKKPADNAALAVAKPKPPVDASAKAVTEAATVTGQAPPAAAPLVVTPPTAPVAPPTAASSPAPY